LLKASFTVTHPAFKYLQGRGISPKTALNAGLGYVGKYQKAQQEIPKIVPMPELQAAGLWNERENLRFYRHRLLREIMAQKVFLVTGATGATGGYAVERLLERGHAVRALARREDNRSACRIGNWSVPDRC
jgi:hypothetical protein